MTRAVYINGVAAFLPGDPVPNEEMEERLGRINGQASRARGVVLRSNGIRYRHYVIDPETGRPRWNNAQLTAEAVRGLYARPEAMSSIETLACGTSIADQLMPSHAVMVQGELGIPPCDVVGTSGVCAASMGALRYAWLSVLAGGSDHAVATGSEVASTMMQARMFQAESEERIEALEQNPEIAFDREFLRWMLSDGAGAVRLGSTPDPDGFGLRVDWLEILSYAGEMPPCMYAGAEKTEDGRLLGWREIDDLGELVASGVLTVKQDVRLLNEAVVRVTVEQAMEELQRRHTISADDVDWFLPHISSEYFRERLAKGLENAGLPIPAERWFTNLSERGNTGSASLFIMLDDLVKSGRLKSGERILCFVPESGRFTSAWLQLTVA